MKTLLTILLGLGLGVAGLVVCLERGLLVHGRPDLRTGVVVLLLIATAQVISFLVFRRHIALPFFFGVALCLAIGVSLYYSRFVFFWETSYPDGSYPITWRSDLVLLLLMSVAQGISFLAVRWIRGKYWTAGR